MHRHCVPVPALKLIFVCVFVRVCTGASPDTHTARHYEAGLSEGLYKHSSVHSTHTNNTDTHNTDTNHITSGGGVSAASGVGRHKEESNAPHGPGPPTRPLSVYMTAPLPANSPLLVSVQRLSQCTANSHEVCVCV